MVSAELVIMSHMKPRTGQLLVLAPVSSCWVARAELSSWCQQVLLGAPNLPEPHSQKDHGVVAVADFFQRGGRSLMRQHLTVSGTPLCHQILSVIATREETLVSGDSHTSHHTPHHPRRDHLWTVVM
jgi:hypothetical protein